LLDVYVENRLDQESFLNTYQRIGIEKFKERVYAPAS
jgi:sulfite reductase (NADPH) hemoprotein beta-component